MERNSLKIGISIGDVNGISPEIIMKALDHPAMYSEHTFIIYGSAKVFSFYKKQLNNEAFMYQSVKSSEEAVLKKVNVVNVWNEDVEIELGKVTKKAGEYAFKSLEAATVDLAASKIDVLVTAPISKESIQKAGFPFPGHTEYLASLSGEEEALMFMITEGLKVAVVTGHLPLKDAIKEITTEKVYDKIKAISNSLMKDFVVRRPKIAVLGLNPHAGENGKMGTEEQEIIFPAIQKAKSEGILAFGPYPADSFFGSSNLSAYDAVLAMYHDQGLVGFKTIAFEDGVNYTAGLPIVRTSPDHGTAFGIAGKDIASGQSMRNAIYWAIDIFRNRELHKEINKNPLKHYSLKSEKGKG